MGSIGDLMLSLKDPRRAQAGTTLVELLVSLSIVGFALVLIVGTLSTGLLDATIAKRNTAVAAVLQYEIDKVGASSFSPSAQAYSECFATEDPTQPALAAGYGGGCPAGPYALRADVRWQWLASTPGVQVWTVRVTTLPGGTPIGTPISVYKAAR